MDRRPRSEGMQEYSKAHAVVQSAEWQNVVRFLCESGNAGCMTQDDVDGVEQVMLQKCYKVLLQGENFLLDMDGNKQKYGFFTTRWVQAGHPSEAEALALQELHNDKKLKGMAYNAADDPPVLRVDEWEEVDALQPATGLALYLDNEAE